MYVPPVCAENRACSGGWHHAGGAAAMGARALASQHSPEEDEPLSSI
jgi:hypothetical protein